MDPKILLIMLMGIFVLYRLGKLEKNNKNFYKDSKGTLWGKTVFSLGLVLIGGIALESHQPQVYILRMVLLISGFELLAAYFTRYRQTSKFNLREAVICLSIFICTILVLELAVKKISTMELFFVILICFVVDTGSNIIGKSLKRFTDKHLNWQWILLRYPKTISPNKSATAALVSVILGVLVIQAFASGGIPTPSTTQTAFIGLCAVAGDIIYSLNKRLLGIKDYFPTLGPIGGVLDRADSWIVALIPIILWTQYPESP